MVPQLWLKLRECHVWTRDISGSPGEEDSSGTPKGEVARESLLLLRKSRIPPRPEHLG